MSRGVRKSKPLEEDRDGEETPEFAKDGARLRRCAATGARLAESRLMRFVAAPDGVIVPDAGAELPGRGVWVTCAPQPIALAVRKRLFAKALKAAVTAPDHLPALVEHVLVKRVLDRLGFARRAGELVLGFDNVMNALADPAGRFRPAALIEAADGAEDGRRKVLGRARALHPGLPVIGCFTKDELGLALARENVIHAALASGGLARGVIAEARRLGAFRPLEPGERAPGDGRPGGRGDRTDD